MMFRTIIPALFISCLSAQAQPSGCGTVLPEEMRQWLIARSLSGQTEKQQQRSIALLPVQFHIVGTTQGEGYYTLGYLATALCELNQQYAPLNFYFYLYDTVHYINNTAYYGHTYPVGYNMMQSNNVQDVINVYVVDDPAGNCGYFSGFADGIAVAKNCMEPGNTTLAHEIGHYFSLPHPFDNVMGVAECVNGSNCTLGGDLFCDTRADYLDYRWDCPYTGSDTDACGSGQVVQPDETLIMSYALDHCSGRFSLQQQSAMIVYLNSDRPYLLIHPDPPVISSLGAAMPFQPEYNDPDVPYNYVELSWTAVTDAEMYYVWASRTVNPASLDFEAYTPNTSIVTQLDSGFTYRWQVTPLAATYTCGPASILFRFTTGAPVNLDIRDGDPVNQVRVFPNPVPSGTAVTVTLPAAAALYPAGIRVQDMTGENVLQMEHIPGGEQITLPITGLAKGLYSVRIACNKDIFHQTIIIH